LAELETDTPHLVGPTSTNQWNQAPATYGLLTALPSVIKSLRHHLANIGAQILFPYKIPTPGSIAPFSHLNYLCEILAPTLHTSIPCLRTTKNVWKYIDNTADLGTFKYVGLGIDVIFLFVILIEIAAGDRISGREGNA
jgi:hypothetical protein